MGDFEDKSKNDFASVFGLISPLIMVRFKKFKNRLTAQDLLYQCMDTFWRSGSIRESALFGTLGAQELIAVNRELKNNKNHDFIPVTVDYCARRQNMCMNDGTCVSDLRGAYCRCTQYWTGLLCGQSRWSWATNSLSHL